METQLANCPGCSSPVRITLTPAPLHEGHANLPDGGELVCLEVGDQCRGSTCPLSGLPRLVMAVRLARSGLREQPWPTTRLRCEGCGEVTEMEVILRTAARCQGCGTINRWIFMELMDHGYVAIGRAEATD